MQKSSLSHFFNLQIRFWIEFFTSAFFVLFLTFISCTNLELGGTDKRFNENMRGDLKTYSDFSPTDPNNFTFAAIGDTHIGSSGGYELAKALPKIKADNESFLVLAGDMTDAGDEGQFKTLLDLLVTSPVVYYPCIGNHDIFFGGWNRYRSYMGRSVYSFNAGIVHFSMIDTANGQIGERQLDWLQKDLKANAGKTYKIVVMHYPPYVGSVGSIFQLSSEEEAAVFKDMMDQNGVNLVLAGHYHGFNDATIGKTRYIVSGGGNNILDPGNSSHYLHITVSPSELRVDRKPL